MKQESTLRICYIFLILIFLFTFSCYTPVLAFQPFGNVIYQGIDVSNWQGNIDFSAVKNSGIRIVYMKTSEGQSYIDPFFEKNYYNAKKNRFKSGILPLCNC